jgi:hypothetical protein
MASNNPAHSADSTAPAGSADSAEVVATVDDDGHDVNADGAATVARVEHDEIIVDDAEGADVANASTAAPVSANVPQYIYVPVALAPVKRGNRLFGSLVALMAAWVYGVLLAIVIAAISIVVVGQVNFGFVASPTFYIPVLFFAVAMVIVVAIANRAGWWSYLIGSVFVALVVYFGSTGMILLINGVVLATPEEARFLFAEVLANPITIAAALVAREVAIWAGLLVSRRGKRVQVANSVARETFAREKAEREASASTVTI